MTFALKRLLPLLLLTLLAGCGSDTPKPHFTTPQPKGDAAKAARANNTFAWALWSKLAGDENQNVFFSPAHSSSRSLTQKPTPFSSWAA